MSGMLGSETQLGAALDRQMLMHGTDITHLEMVLSEYYPTRTFIATMRDGCKVSVTIDDRTIVDSADQKSTVSRIQRAIFQAHTESHIALSPDELPWEVS